MRLLTFSFYKKIKILKYLVITIKLSLYKNCAIQKFE